MSWIDELRRLLERVRGKPPEDPEVEELSCREAVELLFEWLDEELDGAAERAVAAHFEVCTRCYPRLVFERSFRDALRRVAEDGEAPDALKTRIEEALEREGFSGD